MDQLRCITADMAPFSSTNPFMWESANFACPMCSSSSVMKHCHRIKAKVTIKTQSHTHKYNELEIKYYVANRVEQMKHFRKVAEIAHDIRNTFK